jgi:hypothetical protein
MAQKPFFKQYFGDPCSEMDLDPRPPENMLAQKCSFLLLCMVLGKVTKSQLFVLCVHLAVA